MLFPLGGIPVSEYDVSITIAPTSRVDHTTDTALLNIEAQVRNDTAEDVTFPFAVLLTDSGAGATDPASVEPTVINGSEPVALDELDDAAALAQARQRVQAGGSDPESTERLTAWAAVALDKAQRIRVGRTRIKAGQSRRIVLHQRLRLLPDDDSIFHLVTVAPPPLLTVTTGGRISVYVLLPFQDADATVTVLEDAAHTELGFTYKRTQVEQRQIVSWYWQNDPILRLGYRYS